MMAFWVNVFIKNKKKTTQKIEKELYVRVLSGLFLAPMR